MKLLILTQIVDTEDPVLGFFHTWIETFARNVEQVTVICLREGKHNLPENVRVLSLGKESGVSRLKYILNFYRYIFRERKNYDTVFVHMNQVYVILGGLLWRLWGKTVGLWYTHKTVSVSLRLAEKMVHRVFSASATSFRLPSRKLVVTGHGIDTDIFVPKEEGRSAQTLQVLTAGRIAEVKGHMLILEAVHTLKGKGVSVHLTIVGAPVTKEDSQFTAKLQTRVEDLRMRENVSFVGSVPHTEMVKYFQNTDVFVNASATESLDKTILEAMACGATVVSSNDSAEALLKDICPECIFKKQDGNTLVHALSFVRDADVRRRVGEVSRKEVVAHHNLDVLIQKLISLLSYEG